DVMVRGLPRQEHGAHERAGRLEMRALRIARVRHLAARTPEIGDALEQVALRGTVRRDEALEADVVDALREILEDSDRLHPFPVEIVEADRGRVLHEAHGTYTWSAPGSTANVAGVCVVGS